MFVCLDLDGRSARWHWTYRLFFSICCAALPAATVAPGVVAATLVLRWRDALGDPLGLLGPTGVSGELIAPAFELLTAREVLAFAGTKSVRGAANLTAPAMWHERRKNWLQAGNTCMLCCRMLPSEKISRSNPDPSSASNGKNIKQ